MGGSHSVEQKVSDAIDSSSNYLKTESDAADQSDHGKLALVTVSALAVTSGFL